MGDPVEFTRRLPDGSTQRVGNRIVIEDGSGTEAPLSGALEALLESLVPSGPLSGQVAIAVTGTAVVLGVGVIAGGSIMVHALSDNTQPLTVGPAGISDDIDGTGNGHIVEPGGDAVVFCSNLNQVYVNGTQNDVLSYIAAAP